MLETTSRERTVAADGNIARRLAAFAEGLGYEDIPAEVRERAKHHILDAVGIALASSRHDFAQRSLNALRGLGGDGPVAAIGARARAIRELVLGLDDLPSARALSDGLG